MSRLAATLRRMARPRPKPAGLAEGSLPAAPVAAGLPRVAGRLQCLQLDGYRMYVDTTDELVGASIARGDYEPHVTRLIAGALRAGDTFVDLGSNIGYYSLLAAARVGQAGRVIGFEARPDNVWLARLSARENGFGNVTLHNLAVAERGTQLKMHAPDHTSLSKVVEGSVDLAEECVVIPAVALDDALAGVGRVDVLKMDIDGGELRALRGMRGLLRRCRPTLFFEFAPFTLRQLGGGEPRTLLEEIMTLGYRLSGIAPHGGLIDFAGPEEVVAYQASLGIPQAHVDLLGRCA